VIVLSHFQASDLLTARQAGRSSTEISPDLNRTVTTVSLEEIGVRFDDNTTVSWDDIEHIASEENKCFLVNDGGSLSEIRTFSEETNWVRSLYPTESAPTTLVSGYTMHRISGTDPIKDTHEKIKAARPSGVVLDTATGLGYTAIEAAKQAERVVTVELDPAAIEICRLNPWSQELFDNPLIEIVIGHMWDVVEELEDGTFSCIIHDPPAFNIDGELYAGDFYAELYRVLKNRGRLFHYIGDLDSKANSGLVPGVMRRLQDAGFAVVRKVPRAYGVIAQK